MNTLFQFFGWLLAIVFILWIAYKLFIARPEDKRIKDAEKDDFSSKHDIRIL